MTVLLMMQTNSGIAVSDQKIFKKKLTLVLIVNNEHAKGMQSCKIKCLRIVGVEN